MLNCFVMDISSDDRTQDEWRGAMAWTFWSSIILIGRLTNTYDQHLLLIVRTLILQEEDAILDYGLLIYCLDRLHKAVKKPAEKTGEWSRSVHFTTMTLHDALLPYFLGSFIEKLFRMHLLIWKYCAVCGKTFLTLRNQGCQPTINLPSRPGWSGCMIALLQCPNSTTEDILVALLIN